MIIVRFFGAATLSKIDRSDTEHLSRSKTHFASTISQKIIEKIQIKTDSSKSMCICGTCSPGRVAVIGRQNDRATSIDNSRVDPSGCDRYVTSAALSSVRKHRSAQQRDGLLRSCRQCTLVNRGACTSPQHGRWRVRQ